MSRLKTLIAKHERELSHRLKRNNLKANEIERSADEL